MFESHHEAIQRYCFRRLPASDANDAVAEVFLVAWRRIADAPAGDGQLPWLYGIGRNVVASMLLCEVQSDAQAQIWCRKRE